MTTKKVGKSPKCTIKKCGMSKTDAKATAQKLRESGFRARLVKKDEKYCVATCGKRKKKIK